MDIRIKGRIAGLGLLALAAVTANTLPAASPVTALGGASASVLAQPDRWTSSAQATARQNLPLLLANALGDDRAAIKVAFSVAGSDDHVAWMIPVAHRDGRVLAVLADDEVLPPHLASDSPLAIAPHQVIDWSYTGDDGRMHGNYTIRASLGTLSAAHAQQVAAHLAPEAIPAGW